ncbi:hypothetical protein DFH08DRAFT_810336 [Mycena albidolilacea]|uniref:Uncharacterized protein n=1 Tax=Mycena albidolilacea TaxID=1033008 RepID=A0AAD6ZZ70_9AGAR|nr:hypothetical protein DFH08DRAFT_810336 [Mycena albidolilacea]
MPGAAKYNKSGTTGPLSNDNGSDRGQASRGIIEISEAGKTYVEIVCWLNWLLKSLLNLNSPHSTNLEKRTLPFIREESHTCRYAQPNVFEVFSQDFYVVWYHMHSYINSTFQTDSVNSLLGCELGQVCKPGKEPEVISIVEEKAQEVAKRYLGSKSLCRAKDQQKSSGSASSSLYVAIDVDYQRNRTRGICCTITDSQGRQGQGYEKS